MLEPFEILVVTVVVIPGNRRLTLLLNIILRNKIRLKITFYCDIFFRINKPFPRNDLQWRKVCLCTLFDHYYIN